MQQWLSNEIHDANRQMIKATGGKFDLGNFISTQKANNKRSKNTIRGFAAPEAMVALNDDSKDILKKMKELLEGKNKDDVLKLLKQELTREILYIGSECERFHPIDIPTEFKLISDAFTSEYMLLKKVDPPNLERILDEWDTLRPAVVFFSCHGDPMGLFIKDDKGKCIHQNNTDFVNFFRKRVKYTECVVLSSCESLNLGKLLLNSVSNVVCINKKVDITTATSFNDYFLKYLNKHALDNTKVYKNAYDHAMELINYQGLPDSFAFEFLKSDIIQ